MAHVQVDVNGGGLSTATTSSGSDDGGGGTSALGGSVKRNRDVFEDGGSSAPPSPASSHSGSGHRHRRTHAAASREGGCSTCCSGSDATDAKCSCGGLGWDGAGGAEEAVKASKLAAQTRAGPAKSEHIPEHCAKRARLHILQCDSACTWLAPSQYIRNPTAAPRFSQLQWIEKPRSVLIIKKPNDPEVSEAAQKVATKCLTDFKLTVYGEADSVFTSCTQFDKTAHAPTIDFVVCLGGDGTVLHVSSLFSESVPPVICVSMGSLGFMANHDRSDIMQTLTKLMNCSHEGQDRTNLSLRARLRVRLLRAGAKEAVLETTGLNELLLERGASPSMSTIEAYVDGEHLTTVFADGIIISTPTGSTAYNVSAGGSMLMPTVPGMCFTPICAHTLSFRPIIVPDSVTLTLMVPPDCRSSVVASVDGRSIGTLGVGDRVEVTTSPWPMPVVSRGNANQDWITAVTRTLLWNQRQRQKALPMPTAP